MFARLKENFLLAVEGLFGDRYGFFDLMVDAGKLPPESTSVIRLHPGTRRASVTSFSPRPTAQQLSADKTRRAA